MTTPVRRSVRLGKLKELLAGRRQGYTARDLARLTGVHVRTIQRDLLLLQSEDRLPLTEEGGRYALMREERLGPLRLSLHEARAMLIATRLFLRYSDEFDPYAASALRQVAAIMPPAVKDQVSAAAEALARRPQDFDFSRNLALVTEAWAKRRVLRLSYRSAARNRPREVIVEPYFLEPSAAGFATYLIGYSRTHRQIRTFKVERIVGADMLPEAFDVPEDVDLDSLLESAWGIVWGEGQAVELRFTPKVAWRVKESRWHPTQQIEDLADGGCLLTVTVGSLMEIGRWVRSWGDEVEVLAPRELREELRHEAVRAARMYTAPARRPRRASSSEKKQPDHERRGGSVA